MKRTRGGDNRRREAETKGAREQQETRRVGGEGESERGIRVKGDSLAEGERSSKLGGNGTGARSAGKR